MRDSCAYEWALFCAVWGVVGTLLHGRWKRDNYLPWDGLYQD